MRYLSVCSGIEAASIAWHPMGWTPVGFSEIEPFPAAVLAHRFPGVPNFGDMTKYKEWPLEPGSIDLLVGGTPCQSFSVAGLRRGLADPRGNLMLVFLGIAERLRPRWVVYENVPGLLSSGGGRDFGSFLGALGELGYGWSYRVLDAQWCRVDGWPKAVPQRRRRVFVVGCLGDRAAPARVLFERESVQRDSAPRGGAGEEASGDAGEGATGGRWWDGSDIAGTLTKKNAGGEQRMPDKGNFGAVVEVAHSLRGEGFDASEDGTGRGTPIVVNSPGVMFRWQNARDGLVADEAAPSVRASAGSSGFHEMNHTVVAQGVDLYNHAMTGDVAATVTEACGGSNTSGPKVMGFVPKAPAGSRGVGAEEECSPTVTTHSLAQAVAFQPGNLKRQVGVIETLEHNGYSPAHASTQEADPVALLRVLRLQIGEEAFAAWGLGILDSLQPTQILRSRLHGAGVRPAAFTRSWPIDCALSRKEDRSARAMQSVREAAGEGCSPQGRELPEQLAEELGAYLSKLSQPGPQEARFLQHLWQASEGPGILRQALSAVQEVGRSNVDQAQSASSGPMVRRLTPLECEFLMGLPRNWTLVPYRGKPAKDGPRYKACGNSMATNVVNWIGRRIDAVDKGTPLP